ncbi:hypothetical protein AVEN_60741-1 [Araneus ventricosus]|uniref:Uncharacterized protein n=1 Tax=Araneus ventricosus TaxID=182803 RepID=A0A4Y2UHM1_ARAVE|nr:hypothetical protein AVEN_60741-1 [Araneus ventricosus]
MRASSAYSLVARHATNVQLSAGFSLEPTSAPGSPDLDGENNDGRSFKAYRLWKQHGDQSPCLQCFRGFLNPLAFQMIQMAVSLCQGL